MKRIGLLSDTHAFVHAEIPRLFDSCDEIWHAGDFGSMEVVEKLQAIKPLRGVYGNIDDMDVRRLFPELLRFKCEDVDVMMTHIGGYPRRYEQKVLQIFKVNPPALFISGHSHILKVMNDTHYDLLHINPGAAGRQGLHQTITMVRFVIDKSTIKDLEIIEFDKYTH